MDSEGENSLSFAAVRYMKAHYSEKITVEHMAKAVSLSPSQFSRQFKRQTGVPPYEYLLFLRLSKAKELLKPPNFRSRNRLPMRLWRRIQFYQLF